MHQKIHNSTFEQDFVMEPNSKNLWKGSCGSSSISSIEKSYNPVEIKKIVESLVMSKFGLEYRQRFSKRRSRRCLARYLNSETELQSDFSINTCNLSELISNERQSLSTEYLRNNVVQYSDSCGASTEISDEFLNEDLHSDKIKEISAECYLTNSTFKFLSKEMLILNQTKEQILKVIHYDDTSNGGTFSRERLEAEKFLLITDTKIDLLFREAEDSSLEVENSVLFCSGRVKIARIHLWPKEPHYFDQYFLCLILYKHKVYTSTISKIKSNGVIFFNEEFELSSLPPDFQITIKIYSVSLKDFKKHSKSFICDYGRNKIDDEVPLRKSLFSLWGQIQVTLDDLRKSNKLECKLEPGLFTASVSVHADIKMSMSGFMNVSQNCLFWNRQWGSLEGRFLKYFNYPPSDSNLIQTEESVLDLATCKTLRVATREECPRKQTLTLETNDGRKFLISCDSRYEFLCWQEYLKSVLSLIKMWKIFSP